MNFGPCPMVSQEARISIAGSKPIRARAHRKLDARVRLGIVTFTPDDLDWDEEVRIVIAERASLSPDATGMEANLASRQGNLETRIFGRLSAWQNWIFTRPNAVGEHGALKVYGSGAKARFNWERV